VVQNTALAHVALAGQGARLSDMKSVAVQAVLTSAFGKGAPYFIHFSEVLKVDFIN
jgi:hypothetical protein